MVIDPSEPPGQITFVITSLATRLFCTTDAALAELQLFASIIVKV